ncbi:MAG: tetratricopeptide repeat protein [candidate division WOR-3 bacterium]|nr:tetratricopeptide repeat protein [candidate division WOR-3 bacterium]MCX7837096.1 tetratricopeptide repeat protein [candidate division WOR-3 bacterium]MDW8114472.1 tetratricopeptide repeat protein [candidate division WOR-3 bacterium]
MSFLILFQIFFLKEVEDFINKYNEMMKYLKEGNYQLIVKEGKELKRKIPESLKKEGFEWEIDFAIGLGYLGLREYKKAEDIFSKITKDSRNYLKPEATYTLLLISVMRGDFKKGEEELKKLLEYENYQKDERILLAKAIIHYLKKEDKEAFNILKDLSLLEAKIYLAKILAKEDKIISAINILKSIIENNPNLLLTSYCHFLWGEILFFANDYLGAQAKFSYFLENYPTSPLKDFAHYFLGVSSFYLNDYLKAIENLKSLTKSDISFLAANSCYYLGLTYFFLKDYDNALYYLRKALYNFPKEKTSLYAQLEIPFLYLAKKDTMNAILTSLQISQQSNIHLFNELQNYFLALLYYQFKDYEKAFKSLEDILLKSKDKTLKEASTLILLQLSLLTKNEKRGISICERFLKEESIINNKEIYYLLAENLYSLQRFEEAEYYYEKVKNVKGKLGKGYCALHLGRYEEAEEIFNSIYQADLNDSVFTLNALLGLGYASFNKGEYIKAIEYFDFIIQNFNFSPYKDFVAKAYFYAGIACEKLKYYGQALEYYKRLLENYPDYEKADEASFRIGDLYFKAKKYEEAIGSFNYLITRYPNSSFLSFAQAAIGQAYLAKKDYRNAILSFEKFLNLFPNDIQASGVKKSLELAYYYASKEDTIYQKELLKKFPNSELSSQLLIEKAKELINKKDYEKALKLLQPIATEMIDSEIGGDAQLLIAEIYSNRKDWENTKNSYERFLKYFPNHPQREGAYFNLAIAYYNLKIYEKAKENFQIVLDSFPNSDFKELAEKNLEITLKKIGEKKEEK